METELTASRRTAIRLWRRIPLSGASIADRRTSTSARILWRTTLGRFRFPLPWPGYPAPCWEGGNSLGLFPHTLACRPRLRFPTIRRTLGHHRQVPARIRRGRDRTSTLLVALTAKAIQERYTIISISVVTHSPRSVLLAISGAVRFALPYPRIPTSRWRRIFPYFGRELRHSSGRSRSIP